MTKRNEFFIREDLISCYSELQSENVSKNECLNKTQIKKKISKVNKKLKILFKEYGRHVSCEEALSWLNKNNFK